jgi:hypothetical protein
MRTSGSSAMGRVVTSPGAPVASTALRVPRLTATTRSSQVKWGTVGLVVTAGFPCYVPILDRQEQPLTFA